jgi:hypothetical protein
VTDVLVTPGDASPLGVDVFEAAEVVAVAAVVVDAFAPVFDDPQAEARRAMMATGTIIRRRRPSVLGVSPFLVRRCIVLMASMLLPRFPGADDLRSSRLWRRANLTLVRPIGPDHIDCLDDASEAELSRRAASHIPAEWVMPIPDSPVGHSDVASTVLALFEQLHVQIREEVEGLGDSGVNWTPGPGVNSIATIVTHIVGSEAETLLCVAGGSCVRDREGEFAGRVKGVADILHELSAADDLIAELQSEIGPGRLRTFLALPTLPVDERRSGLTWLVGNYGHGREHIGHIQMTKQLYRAGSF